jgi:hypothetical protein
VETATPLPTSGLEPDRALSGTLVAGWLPDPALDPRALLVNGVGGRIIIGLGLTLLDVRRVSVAAMLPARPLVVVLYEGRRPSAVRRARMRPCRASTTPNSNTSPISPGST